MKLVGDRIEEVKELFTEEELEGIREEVGQHIINIVRYFLQEKCSSNMGLIVLSNVLGMLIKESSAGKEEEFEENVRGVLRMINGHKE